MLFNSWSFLLAFLPFSLFAFWVLRQAGQHRLALTSLAAASYVFYAIGEPHYPWLLAVSILINHGVGTAIRRSDATSSRIWMVIGVTFNLLLLGYFKYFNFLLDNLRHAGLFLPDDLKVFLPVGISFYTFTQIAFLVDAHRKKVAQHGFLNYALFVTFFPHFIAGPILHHAEMMPQFDDAARRRRLRDLMSGAVLFAIGLFKKVVVADQAAPLATQVFGMASAG